MRHRTSQQTISKITVVTVRDKQNPRQVGQLRQFTSFPNFRVGQEIEVLGVREGGKHDTLHGRLLNGDRRQGDFSLMATVGVFSANMTLVVIDIKTV